jgi:UDP:flavonoid glycosyltransferase YjiC (YdhE family)
MVVGSRGDVQPFIPIGRRLVERHRVRIATHREFRPMVEEAGLEFYPLGGNPHEMMEYIVKTGGSILPTRLDQLWDDVPKKRSMIAEILASTWRACTEPDPEQPGARPFRADLIVANPPSYGHIHCAEALHIPLHMIFTMPWSATRSVPHPFAQIDPSAHRPVENFFSYGVIDLIVWAGISDLVNTFRTQTLKLSPFALTDGAALLEDHEVPFTYLWPESLVPKPEDWGSYIDLANFIPYEQEQTHQPRQALLDFLAAGEAPIYVGFGSVVAQDPVALTRTIFTALERAGARGIVAEGWAHLGGGDLPPNVYVIGDCPHDWLFPRCRAVCHHGGAGTTRPGCAPVFRPSWCPSSAISSSGAHVAKAGAGPGRFPSVASTPSRSRRPSTPAGAPRSASGRARSAPASDRRRGARRAIDRAPSPGARHVLRARPGSSGRALLRHVSRPPLRGVQPRGASRTSGTSLSLCRLERTTAPRGRGRSRRADRRRRPRPPGWPGGSLAGREAETSGGGLQRQGRVGEPWPGGPFGAGFTRRRRRRSLSRYWGLTFAEL